VLRTFLEQLPGAFKWALELKHVSWLTDEIFDLLASKNVAMTCGENRWLPRSSLSGQISKPTATFAYVRWNDELASNWARKLEKLSSLVDPVYGYFNINACGNGLQLLESSVLGETAASVEQDAS
jgi:uncharacterized protein YecE (DUF72 family)